MKKSEEKVTQKPGNQDPNLHIMDVSEGRRLRLGKGIIIKSQF